MGFKGKLYSETRCGRCDFWAGHIFHVCLDKEDPTIKVVHPIKKKQVRTAEHKANMSEAQRKIWSKRKLKNAERDAEIVRLYEMGDIGVKNLAAKFGIAYQTCRNIINEAGVMRSPGQWVQRSGVVNSHR